MSFRDAFPRFEGLDTVIYGLSPDDVASHARFRKKHRMPFHLLADTEHKVAEAYGVWQRKAMYGKLFYGVVRSTFIVGPDGTVAKVFEKVKPEGHADEVIEALEKLGPAKSRK